MIKSDDPKKAIELQLTPEQIKKIEELTGLTFSELIVEAEPFDKPPLGTPVMGKIITDPRSKVVARVRAQLKQ